MSSGGSWSRMWDVFHAALEVEENARDAYVNERCGGDAGLRERVESLLEAHGRAGGFLEVGRRDGLVLHTAFLETEGAVASAGSPGDAAGQGDRQSGGTGGRYEIKEKIGEGGFAEVFLAQQTEPVRREVAVKVLREGGLGGRLIQRFESERQTLAGLHHPGIATIFDAGVREDGRPYFVMEHIAGATITRHCRERGLGLRERLDLFTQTCAAVQHAHHKGVIHRDLKPSNVLVTEVDGQARVKVIDFGISTVVGEMGSGDTGGGSGTGWHGGTPGYMSPEQAGAGDVDTRTDVFSLGVVLYELLAGVPPFDVRGRGVSALLERSHVESGKDPLTPSARVRAMEARTVGGERPPSATGVTAGGPSQTPPLPPARLRGDLDWIVMRALERDRAKRYGSPAEMAADVARHLEHRPVAAAPGGGSAGYRTGKFVRRHRAGVAMALVLAGLGMAGVGVLAQTAQTEARLRAAAEKASEEAKRQQRITQAVNQFLTQDILGAADPRRTPNPDITVREAIEAAEAKVAERFKDEPLVEAAVRHTLGETYRSMGKYDKAVPNLERAAALLEAQVGLEDQRTLEAVNDLGILYKAVGRTAEAEQIYLKGIEIRKRLLGPEARDTLQATVNLGVLYFATGRLVEAEKVLRETLGRINLALGPDHEDAIATMQHLGVVYNQLQEYAKAEPLLRAAYEHERRARGEDHPYTVAAMGNLASVLERLGRAAEAEPLLLQAVEACVRRAGEEHADTAVSRMVLGMFYDRTGRYAEAEPLMKRALEGQRAALGPDHPRTFQMLNNLGTLYDHWKRDAEAEPYYRIASDGARAKFAETNANRGMFLANHGACLVRLGQLQDAEDRLLEALRILEATLGAKHQRTRDAMGWLANLYDKKGRPDEAARYRARIEEAGGG